MSGGRKGETGRGLKEHVVVRDGARDAGTSQRIVDADHSASPGGLQRMGR